MNILEIKKYKTSCFKPQSKKCACLEIYKQYNIHISCEKKKI